MDDQNETLVRLSSEQIILRAAVKWLLACEARRSGNIDVSLQAASEAIGNTIAAMPISESLKGPLQENLDQLIASARLEVR